MISPFILETELVPGYSSDQKFLIDLLEVQFVGPMNVDIGESGGNYSPIDYFTIYLRNGSSLAIYPNGANSQKPRCARQEFVNRWIQAKSEFYMKGGN